MVSSQNAVYPNRKSTHGASGMVPLIPTSPTNEPAAGERATD